jgi:hypothetical protein
VFKRELYNIESLHKCIQRTYTMFWILMGLAKHFEFYVGQLWLNATSTGNAVCFKGRFTMAFQILPCGKRYENVYTERRTNYSLNSSSFHS